jgi:hypothetical protein
MGAGGAWRALARASGGLAHGRGRMDRTARRRALARLLGAWRSVEAEGPGRAWRAWATLMRTGRDTVNNASISLAASPMAVLFCSTRACPSLERRVERFLRDPSASKTNCGHTVSPHRGTLAARRAAEKIHPKAMSLLPGGSRSSGLRISCAGAQSVRHLRFLRQRREDSVRHRIMLVDQQHPETAHEDQGHLGHLRSAIFRPEAN